MRDSKNRQMDSIKQVQIQWNLDQIMKHVRDDSHYLSGEDQASIMVKVERLRTYIDDIYGNRH